jgi:PIN domain nuclease of toxin-antitoxin system
VVVGKEGLNLGGGAAGFSERHSYTKTESGRFGNHGVGLALTVIAGVADTHTAIWYLFDDVRLSREAGSFIDHAANDGYGIAISSVSLAEIVYLTEKGRIAPAVYRGLRVALADPLHVFREAALTMEIVEAMRQVLRIDLPDLPDRIVAATGLYFGVPVISRDGRIRSSKVQTIW